MKHAFQYENLWDSFKEGDKAAFAEIYRKYAVILLNYGSKISSDNELIEDSIQDLFVDLWQSRANISRTTSVKFYLFKALRNKIYRNKGTLHNEMESIDSHLHLLKDPAPSYEDYIIQLEVESSQMKHLRETLENLPARQREAINLRYYHNFSNEEIARIMGITYPAACKFIYSGLKKLIDNLKLNVGVLAGLVWWAKGL